MAGQDFHKENAGQGAGALATVVEIDLGSIVDLQAGLLFLGTIKRDGGGNLLKTQLWLLDWKDEGGSFAVVSSLVHEIDPAPIAEAFTFDISGNMLRARANVLTTTGVAGKFIGVGTISAVTGG